MIDRQAVLQIIADFLCKSYPSIHREHCEELLAGDFLRESLDLVEFVLHLEERLGVEINMSTLGGNLTTKNFGELADELSQLTKSS
jgi:acyl carrier protein